MKKITIENLLTWAFMIELPKIGAGTVSLPGFSPSDVMAQMMELGTSIDKSPNGFGVISGFVYEGEPHADAVIVGDAVKGLAARDGYEIGEGWSPFPDWDDEHGLIAAEVARVVRAETGRAGRINGKHVVQLVTTSAILKRGPDWEAKQPKVVMHSRAGRPSWFVTRQRVNQRTGEIEYYEDDGFDAKKQKPRKDAYRKYRLDGSIRGAIVGRLEWQLWQSALEILVAELAGKLAEHEILPFRPVRAPWRTVSQREVRQSTG